VLFMKNFLVYGLLFLFTTNAYAQRELLCGFKNGLQEGICKQFYDNGQVSESVEWEKGKMNGDAFFYYKNGSLQAKGKFKKNFKIDTWEYFFESGKIKTIENFKVIENTQVKEGLFTYFYENGNKNEVSAFKDNKREGTYTFYYENGNLKQKGNCVNDLFTGLTENYEEKKGMLESKGNLDLKGLRTGEWTFYYDDGKTIFQSGNYTAGDFNGKWTAFYANGNKQAESTYVNGKREGKRNLYNEKGELTKTEVYAGGALVN
jgi:antitoxin component YwqK of YwqJK toxin-antitoxin module